MNLRGVLGLLTSILFPFPLSHSNKQGISGRFELSHGLVIAKIDGNHAEGRQQFANNKQGTERLLFEWQPYRFGGDGKGIPRFIQRSSIPVSALQDRGKLFEICRHDDQSGIPVPICVQRTRFVFRIFHWNSQRLWRRAH